ncbi:MAG: hypothetical protein ABEJ69_01260 [Candidatus Nanohaloarchaea archaeon]
MNRKFLVLGLVGLLMVSHVSAVSWNKVVQWDRENNGDTLSDFENLMTEEQNNFRSDSNGWEQKSNYIQWEENEGGNSGSHDTMRYSYSLPQNQGNIRVRLHFYGSSFEASGISFYAVDKNGNRHNIVCEPDSATPDNYDCSASNDPGSFTFDNTYTNDFGVEITHFKIASALDDCCDDGGDWAGLYRFTVWTGESGPSSSPSFRSPTDGATVGTTDPTLAIQASDPQNDDITYTFYDGSGSTIGSETVASGQTATVSWNNLNNGNSYSWSVEACDSGGACTSYATWDFTVDTSSVYTTYSGNEERDEDYNPQGVNQTPVVPPFYYGHMNKMEDMSNQLEPGMGTTVYGLADPGLTTGAVDQRLDGSQNVDSESDAKWHDSMGRYTRADQWAITRGLTWAISNRGVPYPPGKTYYHKDYSGSERSTPKDVTSPKTVKVFGNSLAVVAAQQMTSDQGTTVHESDGVWIDPDDLKQMSDNGQIREYWQDVYRYNIDLTGPDSGLGLFTGHNAGITFMDPSRGYVMYGNVYFEGEEDKEDTPGITDMDSNKDEGAGDPTTVGESKSRLEPPMCGDDQSEFLLEEMGESTKSDRFDGRYACTDSRDVCVDMSADGSKVFEIGEYRQTDEPDEGFGRLKRDSETCRQLTASEKPGQSEDDYVPMWYDQDYAETFCRNQNNLYGTKGLKWTTKSYVDTYPAAVRGGIDDDWNSYLQRKWENGGVTQNYTSVPYKSDWYSGEPTSTMRSPVPSGAVNQSVPQSNRSIATLGFCAGDDGGEHLIHQECQTDVCETDNSIMGVAENPNWCVMKNYDNINSQYGESSNTERKIYPPGSQITFSYSGGGQSVVSCYGGQWYENWPVVFQRGSVEILSGETRAVSFKLINPESDATTYEVQMSPSGINDAWAEFSKNGTSFTATVSAQSSKSYSVQIYGGSTDITPPDHVEVIAESKDGDISGSDSVEVDVVESADTEAPQTDSQNVPGIGALQLMVLALTAGAVYFFAI